MANDSVIAVIGALFGGVGLKAIEKLFLRQEKKLDDATQIRKELREEIGNMKKEIAELKKEITDWQEKYYDLHSEYTELKVRYSVVKEDLERLRTNVISNRVERAAEMDFDDKKNT